MKKLLGIVFLSLLLSGNTYADTIYNGTLIDAHSQVGKLISNETVSKIINHKIYLMYNLREFALCKRTVIMTQAR